MLSLLLVPAAGAFGQRVTGKEATAPKHPPPERAFELRHDRSRSFSFPDGDPESEDAPMVLAVAGGAEVWFQDYYLTAQNLLLFTDALDATSSDAAETSLPPAVRPPRVDDGLPGGFASGGSLLQVDTTTGSLRELYAEGDVYITQGRTKVIQADRVYFNLLEDRSLIVGGEIRTDLASVDLTGLSGEEGGGGSSRARDGGQAPIPIVIRAAEIRGVSRGLYEARAASITTSTFGKPGYHVAMDRMTYEERALELGGLITGQNNRLVLGDVPLLSVPYLTIRTGVESPFPLIGLRLGASSRFGAFIETRWGNVFQQAGDEFNRSIGVSGDFEGLWFADINLYSKRGLGLGAGVEYETKRDGETIYFGSTEFFAIDDISGDDETGRDDNSGLRGRLKSLNRAFLPDRWQLDTELNLVSDRSFLREFKQDEFDEEKEPETLVYLKKLDGDTAVSALARFRLNPWQTQTQYLPQATYDVVSRPIVELPRLGQALAQDEPIRVYWSHRSEAGFVDRRVGDFREDRTEGTAFRIDDVERLNMPFEIGAVGVDPYVESRFTLWAGDGQADGGGALRTGLTTGFSASTQFWKTDPDVESEYWNIHGIRHIVIPNLRYRWTFLSTVDSRDLVPYDRVERFDRLHALIPGVISRYQTKRLTTRGPETVTFLEFDIQQPLVFDNARDDDIDTLAPLFVEARYRPDLERYLLRRSTFRANLNWNWSDSAFDSFRTEFRTEPGPDLFARVAYSFSRRGRVSPTMLFEGFAPRRARNNPLNALTFEVAWQATRLWEFVVLQQFDISGTDGGESRFILRRRTADWMFELGLGVGSAGLGTGLGITVTPVAFFEKEERERFKTALSDGYDLTPVFDEEPYSTGPALDREPVGPPRPPSEAR